jgi:endonuclease-8
MEGPSLYLAAEQLSPLVGEVIKKVTGNTKIGKERLAGEKILNIFSYGKYLFFQFETFALRVHFLLFGSFQATIKRKKVTGDYPKKALEPRLALKLNSCSSAIPLLQARVSRAIRHQRRAAAVLNC